MVTALIHPREMGQCGKKRFPIQKFKKSWNYCMNKSVSHSQHYHDDALTDSTTMSRYAQSITIDLLNS